MKLTIMAVAHLPKAKQIYILQLPSLRYTCSKQIPFVPTYRNSFHSIYSGMVPICSNVTKNYNIGNTRWNIVAKIIQCS